jgi:hypothetical protein
MGSWSNAACNIILTMFLNYAMRCWLYAWSGIGHQFI